MKTFILDMEKDGCNTIFICFAEVEAKWIESALEVPAYVFDEFMFCFENGPLHLDSKTLLLINETHNFPSKHSPNDWVFIKDVVSDLGCTCIPYNFAKLLLERQYSVN